MLHGSGTQIAHTHSVPSKQVFQTHHLNQQSNQLQLLLLGNEAINVVQRTHALLEVNRKRLQDAIGRVEHKSMNARIQLILGNLSIRVSRLELLAHLVAAALHHSSLVQVQALLHHVQLHQSQVLSLIILRYKKCLPSGWLILQEVQNS